MLTNEEIVAYTERAFLPFCCAAQIWDYNKKLRFRVFNSEDRTLATMEEAVLSTIREVHHLEALIQSVRLHIERKEIQSNA